MDMIKGNDNILSIKIIITIKQNQEFILFN